MKLHKDLILIKEVSYREGKIFHYYLIQLAKPHNIKLIMRATTLGKYLTKFNITLSSEYISALYTRIMSQILYNNLPNHLKTNIHTIDISGINLRTTIVFNSSNIPSSVINSMDNIIIESINKFLHQIEEQLSKKRR